MPSKVSYRVRCSSTCSGWAWDVSNVQFFSDTVQVHPLSAIDSANAGGGWGPQNALGESNNLPWGGRVDGNGEFWIGGIFDANITSVKVLETSRVHRASDPYAIIFEKKGEDGKKWETVSSVTVKPKNAEINGVELQTNKDKDTKVEKWEPIGPTPTDEELTTKPSKPLSGKVHGVCYKSNLHCPPPNTFAPDEAFYYSENCEGLWVCCSKACGQETLERVCKFVRAVVPPEQRAMWGRFRSPKWAKDPGPMRLVVLDNRTNERAGVIPELRDESTGRNQTSCPFVFTSREDFYGGVGNGCWCEKQLTLHEMTHGSDMVIRQMLDPSFHDEVGELWSKYRDKFRHTDLSTSRTIILFDTGANTVDEEQNYSYCYAAANRDEFLAEAHCIAQGLHIKSNDYIRCNISTPKELVEAMPEVHGLLGSHFSLPRIEDSK
mmetsp:Transcript_21947/g.33289  ORF Transcript_21947/g.33289 Transcript_21947/m.33289 type:complete len:435 (+) Transcript_21947:252-1556(+)